MTRWLAVLILVLVLLTPLRARADFRVHSPYEIDLGEFELEHNGSASFDRRAEVNGAQSYTLEIGTGLTRWWRSELELGFDRDPGLHQPALLTQIVSENTFQLTEPGEYFADVGFYAEYGQSLKTGARAGSNQVTFGPLIAKETGRITHTVNLFLTRQLGPDQDTQGLDFSFAWQSRWNVWAPLSPAVEIYGNTGTLGSFAGFTRQQLIGGPVAIGAVHFDDFGLGHGGKLKYELGWLFGLTPASPAGTLRWRLEMEIPF